MDAMGGRMGRGDPVSSIWPGQSNRRDGHSCVIMVYGMHPKKMNCQSVFNLFCNYGNVNRIMFLKNKEGCCMLEMADPDAVDRSIKYLNGMNIFGESLKLDVSRSLQRIEEVRAKFDLPDGTQSSRDYWGDRNNRFDNPERAAKNRIIAPTRNLHFFNIPKMSDSELEDLFGNNNAPLPSRIKWFPSKTEKSCLGLLEFNSVEDALEAMVVVNHVEIETAVSQKYPYEIKLCFSPAKF